MQSVVFIAAYGWYIGKPLVYVIKWIGNIATGEFQAPLSELELPEGKKIRKIVINLRINCIKKFLNK